MTIATNGPKASNAGPILADPQPASPGPLPLDSQPRIERSKLNSRLLVPACGAILALLAALLLGLLVPPPGTGDEMSKARVPNDVVYDPLQFTYGFYPPEQLPDGTTYEWTAGKATMSFPFAANEGRILHVSMRVASGWGQGQQQAKATLLLNGKPAADFTAPRVFTVVDATIDTAATPNPYLDPSHLQIDVTSTISHVLGDKRDLGIAVDWIRVQPERSGAEILLEGLVWALAIAAVLFVATTRLGLPWGIIFGLSALISLAALYVTYLPRGVTPAVEEALAGGGWLLTVLVAPKRWPALGLVLAGAMLWMVVAGRVMGDWQMDDAYISYRYAWNFVHGNGLVYNPGEIVEGYTNFLWTLVAAGALLAGLQPGQVTLVLNIALTAGLLAMTWYLASKLSNGRHVWSVVAMSLLVVDGSLLAYGARGSGMEAMPFAFLVLLSVLLLFGMPNMRGGIARAWPPVAGGVALALCALTRPEGLLVAAVLITMRFVAERFEPGGEGATPPRGMRGPHWLRLAAAVVPFMVVVVPYELWRISFYGYLFPNTFYAKTGTTTALVARGMEYTGYFVTERGVAVALAVVGALFALARWRRDALRLALVALLVVFEGYIVWVGGDYFPSWRFFVPLLAPLMLVAVEGARFLVSHLPKRRAATLAAVVVGALLVLVYYNAAIEQLQPDSVHMSLSKLHNSYVNLWGTAGLWLRDNTTPDTTTAAKGAGAIAYYGNRYVIDVYGLNDLHIGHLPVGDMGAGKAGHEKSDPAYVLARRPGYIYGQWANYFDPLATQLAQQYKSLTVNAPTGPTMDWLVRK